MQKSRFLKGKNNMLKSYDKSASCDLENELFKSIFDKTPDYIKELDLIDFNNKDEFVFTLRREHLYKYDEKLNPDGLNLLEWFDNYEKEAKVSTAGIRGPQNILYPQDTRFPINLIGIIIATLAKALVAVDKSPNKKVTKIAAREVRYNSDLYLEAIARIQAAYGIKTLLPEGRKTLPIWLVSFLAFKLDLFGGEYITSSHGISVKNATKDLNSQGSQYLPEESMEFVDKIKEIFKIVEYAGYFDIKIAKSNDPLIDEHTMSLIHDGVDLYVDYLKSGVAKKINLDSIKKINNKIIIENVGGSAYRTLNRVLKKLDISEHFDWFNIEEDPFFHSIGKYDVDNCGNKCFYDYSVDATVIAKNQAGERFFPVIDSLHYDKKLANYPINTIIFITDPDHDRLTITQIESLSAINSVKKAGIDYIRLSSDRILTIYTANQAFLMIMDFWAKQLKLQKIWDNHPRFIIKTTASALSWDEWAHNNGVRVINVPVGFKEIANIIKKVESKIENKPLEDVIVDDIFGNAINLGVEPRLIFAGEESGGMIIGSEEIICSESNCKAIAMREKSATEAIIVASALAAKLEEENKTLSQQLVQVFEDNKIIGKFDTRADISYYNESEPDINKMKEEKLIGEEKRTKNDLFYLSLAMGVKFNIITLDQVKEVLNDAFCDLDFSNLKSIKFVGDGTYLVFDDKYIEVRPSGTDAKTKSYAAGLNKAELEKYSRTLGYFPGDRTALHKKFIPTEFYYEAQAKAMSCYLQFVDKV